MRNNYGWDRLHQGSSHWSSIISTAVGVQQWRSRHDWLFHSLPSHPVQKHISGKIRYSGPMSYLLSSNSLTAVLTWLLQAVNVYLLALAYTASDIFGLQTLGHYSCQGRRQHWGWGVLRSPAHASGTVGQLPFEPQRSRLWRSPDISRATCLIDWQRLWGLFRTRFTNLRIIIIIIIIHPASQYYTELKNCWLVLHIYLKTVVIKNAESNVGYLLI